MSNQAAIYGLGCILIVAAGWVAGLILEIHRLRDELACTEEKLRHAEIRLGTTKDSLLAAWAHLSAQARRSK